MKVARIGSPGPGIAPFGEPAGELPLLHETISAHQERCVREAGAELVDVSDSESARSADAAFNADTIFDVEALRQLLAMPGAARVVGASGSALSAIHTRFIAGARPEDIGMWRHEPDAATLVSLVGAPERVYRVAPRGPSPHCLHIPVGAGVALAVESWVDYLDAALIVLGQQTQKLRRNMTGKRVRISKSAHVERSIIADGATIDSGASVIDSYIGPDCIVAPHTVFHSCVVGAGCNTLIDSDFRRSVFMAGTTISNVGLEDSVIGRSSFVTTAVSVYDQLVHAPMQVGGREISRPSLGIAVGHNVTLGARALFEAGVSVPSGSVIVMRPDEGITKLTPEGLAAAHAQVADASSDIV